MATYLELEDLFGNGTLKAKIRAAVIIAAESIRTEDPATANHANRLIWAKQAFSNTESAVSEMLKATLAANKDASVAQITGASDATVQAAVDAAVDIFADGGT